MAAVLILALGLSTLVSAQALRENDPDLDKIDIIEKRGDSIPLDLMVTNDHGETVPLSSYFTADKPVILVMAYYTCPMLCNLVLNGVADAASKMDWVPGDKYEIVTVSIDPTETVELAAAKKKNYINSMGKPEAADGWAFCITEESQSKRLADAIGFKYFYIKEKKQYAHAAVITILTPEGVVSRYLYGIEFSPRDLKLALLEASEGKIGSTFDRVLLYCYHYDPDAGGYVAMAGHIMTLGGVITMVLLGAFLGIYWFRESRRKSISSRAASPDKTTK